MSNRLVVVALVAALVTTSACTPGRAAIAAGAGSLVLGGLSLAGGQSSGGSSCTGSEGACDFVDGLLDPPRDSFNEGQRDLGAALMIGGAALVIIGLVAEGNRSKDDAPAATSALTFAPAQRVVGAPGMLDAPMVERTASPAEMALRSRLENRLAIQASFTARRGDCVAAVATSVRLAEVDPAMHAELVRTDADLAHCLELAAARQN